MSYADDDPGPGWEDTIPGDEFWLALGRYLDGITPEIELDLGHGEGPIPWPPE